MLNRTMLVERRKLKIPWYVKQRIPPEEVRRRLFEGDPQPWSFITQKEWDAFLKRKGKGELKPKRGANTTLPCPGCGRFLRHFFITERKEVLEQAKDNAFIFNLISGYVCWFPCFRVYFLKSKGKLTET